MKFFVMWVMSYEKVDGSHILENMKPTKPNLIRTTSFLNEFLGLFRDARSSSLLHIAICSSRLTI